MRRVCHLALILIMLISTARGGGAAEPSDLENWRRIDSKYCTIWLHPSVEAKQINKRVSTWRVHPQVKIAKSEPEEVKLAAKFDTIFQRAQEILDMYPAGVHVTVRVVRDRDEVEGIHAHRYGYDTNAVAFYDFEDNTVFVALKDLSEGVLVHEMAHCIIDHYFRVRPPRKIEELLAMHADEHLRD